MLKGCGKTFLHKSVLSDEQVDFLYSLKIEKLCSKMDFVQSTKNWLRLFSHLWGNCSFLFLFCLIDRIGCELYVEWSVWENTKLWQREKDIWEGKRGLRSGKRKGKKIFKKRKKKEVKLMFGQMEKDGWELIEWVKESEEAAQPGPKRHFSLPSCSSYLFAPSLAPSSCPLLKL